MLPNNGQIIKQNSQQPKKFTTIGFHTIRICPAWQTTCFTEAQIMHTTDQQLRAFLSLSDTAHQTPSLLEAAHDMGISQQALGKLIKAMEDDLQVPLFVRYPRYRLSYAGNSLMPHAASLFSEKTRFLSRVHAACNEVVDVASDVTSVSTLSPAAAAKMRIHETSTAASCIDCVIKGQAEMMYTRYMPDTPMEYIPIIEEPIMAIMSYEHPLAQKSKLTLDDLRQTSILTSLRLIFPYNLVKLCIESGFSPHIKECVNMLSLLTLLKERRGITLFPPAIHEEHNLQGLVCRPIEIDGSSEIYKIGFYVKPLWRENPNIRSVVDDMLAYRRNVASGGAFSADAAYGEDEQVRSPHASGGELHISENQIRIVTSVLTAGSISAAAKQLGCSQQAASKSLMALEKELGVILFERRAHAMTPTQTCRLIMDDFFHIRDEYDAWYTFVKSKHGENGLVIAIENQFMRIHMPSYMAGEDMPEFALVPCSSVDVGLKMIDSGLADAVYCRKPDLPPQYEYFPAIETGLFVVMSSSHPLAGRSFVTSRELKDENIIMMGEDEGAAQLLTELFGKNGLSPEVIYEGYYLPVIIKMVRANRGITVLQPYVLSTFSMEHLAKVPLREPGATFSAGFVVPAGSPLMEKLASASSLSASRK